MSVMTQLAAELLYMGDESRNPRNILTLYNCTWLHHELCNKYFVRFHGSVTQNQFFGIYLHSLVAHATRQLELASLRAVNTYQERLFEQARRSADVGSNNHANNVISSTILR